MAKLSYIKIGGSYEEASNVYVKENDSWVEKDIVNIYWKDASWSQATSTPKSGMTSAPVVIHDYSQDYLTFRILSDGYINWKYSGSSSTSKTISYSKDNGTTWTNVSPTTAGTQINVSTGDRVLFKGNNTTYASNATNFNTFSASTSSFDAEGNIMSLFYSDDFADKTVLPNYTYSCVYLFAGSTVRNAKNLILPSLTLRNYCYYSMFRGCINLTMAPKILPATALTQSCYYSMFQNCTSLTTAPELPATTLAQSCYYSMFLGCTSLTTAPELPATTVTSNCYQCMFQNCSNLRTAPELPATTLANSCYYQMFNGCPSLTTAPELPATTLAPYCYSYMFQNCTSLTTAPELPATTLAAYCYRSMFQGCLNLLRGPISIGDSSTTMLSNACAYMFHGCASIMTAPELPATTLGDSCYAYMFSGCTSLITAPELPATTLVSGCYNYMFRGCSSLNYIKALFTTEPSTTYTNNWVNSVATYGIFIKNDNATWNVTGNNGVPTNWTTGYTDYSGETLTITTSFTPSGYVAFTPQDESFIGLARKYTNHTVYFSYNGTDWGTPVVGKFYHFTNTNKIYVCGNLTSDSSSSNTRFMLSHGLVSASGNCNSIWNYSNLNATLRTNCGYQMFYGCTNLATAPELPATTLANYCYYGMFSDCRSLTTAPELPATTLASNCYQAMFQNCTSLSTAPELSATTLAGNCYWTMFYGCTNLNSITCLATNISASGCLNNWVSGVSRTGTFTKAASMTSWPSGTSGIPNGWTIVDAT